MAEVPLVTVVIPTRNRPHLVSRAIASALAQVAVRVEVIVVDDHSSTRPLHELPAAGVTWLRQEAWSGVSAARNRGIAAASAPWIALLDDDDVWSPHKLSRQLDAASESGAAFVYSDAVLVSEAGTPRRGLHPPRPSAFKEALRWTNALPSGPSNVIAKADLLRSVGPFDTQLSYLADWDMWLRLSAHSVPAHVAEPLVGYVLHSSSMTGRRDYDFEGELRHLHLKHPDLFIRDGALDRAHVFRLHGRHERYSYHPLRSARYFLQAALAERRIDDVVQALASLARSRPRHGRGPSLHRAARRPTGARVEFINGNGVQWLPRAWNERAPARR